MGYNDFKIISNIENDEGFWIVLTINTSCGWDGEEYFRTVILEGGKDALENYIIKKDGKYFEKTDSETMDEAINIHREKRFLLQNNKIKLNTEKTRRQLSDNISIAISELKDKIEFEEINEELIKEIRKHLSRINTSIWKYKNFQEIQKYKHPKEEKLKSADLYGLISFEKDKKINKKEQQQLRNLFSNNLFFVDIYEDKLIIDRKTWFNDLEIEEAFKKVIEEFFIPKKIKIEGKIEITREEDDFYIVHMIKFSGYETELIKEVSMYDYIY